MMVLQSTAALDLSNTLALNNSTNGTYTLSLALSSFAASAIAYSEGTDPWNNSSGISGGSFYDQRGIGTPSPSPISIGAYSDPPPLYYKAKNNGDWSDKTVWFTSATVGGDYNTPADNTPNADNFLGIIIDADVTVDADVTIHATTVNSGATITIASGKTVTVQDRAGTDFTVTGGIVKNGNLILDEGTIVLYNGGNQTIAAASYDELQLANATTGALTTKTFADGITKVEQQIELVLTENMTLTGSSADNVTVQVTTPYNWNGTSGDANATASRVFYVLFSDATISNMTIKGGDISDVIRLDDAGGGIYIL